MRNGSESKSSRSGAAFLRRTAPLVMTVALGYDERRITQAFDRVVSIEAEEGDRSTTRDLERHGAAVFVGLNPIEEAIIRGLDGRLIEPLTERESETVQITLKPDGEDQPLPSRPLSSMRKLECAGNERSAVHGTFPFPMTCPGATVDRLAYQALTDATSGRS